MFNLVGQFPLLQSSNSNRYSPRRIEICCSFKKSVSFCGTQSYHYNMVIFTSSSNPIFVLYYFFYQGQFSLAHRKSVNSFVQQFLWIVQMWIYLKSHRRVCRFFCHCEQYISKGIALQDDLNKLMSISIFLISGNKLYFWPIASCRVQQKNIIT